MRSLRRACAGKTSLFIAHRLATIVDADIIYVLENGKIIESGSHLELVNRIGGKYSRLWKSQHRVSNIPPTKQQIKPDAEILDLEFEKCCGNSSCNR